MSILRTEEQIALGQLFADGKAWASHLREAGETCHDPTLRALYQDVANQLESCNRKMGKTILALDDLPPEPDPDQETVKHVIRSIAAVVSADEETEVLRQRLAEGEKLARESEERLASDCFRSTSRPVAREFADRIHASVDALRKSLKERGGESGE